MTDEAPDQRLEPPEEGGAQLLASVPLFEGIDGPGAAELAQRAQWLRVPGGSLLFAEGAEPDGVYVLARGRLRVTRRRADGRVEHIEVASGGAVGEFGVLSGRPRSATVHVVRDSVLAVLDRELVEEVFGADPQRALRLARLVATRSESGPGRRRAQPARAVALVPACDAADARQVAGELDRLLPNVARLDGADQAEATGIDPAEAIARREADADHVLVVCDAAGDRWNRTAMRQADLMLVVAPAGGLARVSQPVVDAVRNTRRSAAPVTAELVVLHGQGADLPTGTAVWCDRFDLERVHHLSEPEGWRRLARRVAGTQIGLVLSGGGARAMAHLGAVRVLAGAGVPIDLLGGTSMGGFVAANLAVTGPVLDESAIDDLIGRVRTEMLDLNLGLRFTLPLLSILSVRRVCRAYDRLFGGRQFEDGWRSAFVTTADLTACRLTVVRRGSIATWARASGSAPGMWPPVVDDAGHLHVDGAVFDNLPVEPLVDRDADRVIAVNASNRGDFGVEPGSPQVASPVEFARQRFQQGPGRSFPVLGSILGRTVVVASLAAQERASALADAVIEPEVAGVALADYRSFDRMVAAGEAAARRWLDSVEISDWVP